MLISQKIIITISGTYNIMTYFITNDNNNIISEIQILSTTIDVSSLLSNIIPYYITVNLKRSNGSILASNSLYFTL